MNLFLIQETCNVQSRIISVCTEFEEKEMDKKKPESHYRSLNLVCPWKQNKNNNVVKIQFMVWDPWESESFFIRPHNLSVQPQLMSSCRVQVNQT